MISFQGLKYKTVKITDINPVEDLAFTHCTAFIVQFLFVVALFQFEAVFSESKQFIANNY